MKIDLRKKYKVDLAESDEDQCSKCWLMATIWINDECSQSIMANSEDKDIEYKLSVIIEKYGSEKAKEEWNY